MLGKGREMEEDGKGEGNEWRERKKRREEKVLLI